MCKKDNMSLQDLYTVSTAACGQAVRDTSSAEKSAATANVRAELEAKKDREAKRTAPAGSEAYAKVSKSDIPAVFTIESPHRQEMSRVQGTIPEDWDFTQPVIISCTPFTDFTKQESVSDNLQYFTKAHGRQLPKSCTRPRADRNSCRPCSTHPANVPGFGFDLHLPSHGQCDPHCA